MEPHITISNSNTTCYTINIRRRKERPHRQAVVLRAVPRQVLISPTTFSGDCSKKL